MKRHFRDKRWQIRGRRPARELFLEIRNSTADLAQQLGHSPGDDELAAHLGVTSPYRTRPLIFWPASITFRDPGTGGQEQLRQSDAQRRDRVPPVAAKHPG